ncbi:LamG-like jellyroll fold domain-containing protein [Devosia faecipullorum]|uniref:LamG-like jellyroll fold domain-containing protein n=1 Tax=Devosia faecipullorum TaxID=2755039 RepID=UPI00187B26EA|nr:LamG-like jellyroll fold domain-containing protein [Devosia faecipullorum]MBE7731966.1 hypothetical protein [Devosia faecipullorum]
MNRSPRESEKIDRTDLSRRSFLVGAASLAASPALAQAVSGSTAFVSPDGEGDGVSPENAAPFAALGELIRAVGPGGTIYILADRGEYRDWDTAIIDAGGTALAPVNIRGVDSGLRPGNPVFFGSRTPWTRPIDEGAALNAAEFGGNTAFEFTHNAGHLHFSDMSFSDVGRIFNFAGQRARGITIEDIAFLNVRDGFFTDENSELEDVVLRRFSGVGFSKKGIRMHGRSHGWLVEGCDLDSGWQFGDNFSVGIELNHEAHDLTIRGGYTINGLDTQDGDQEKYWNADGVAAERGNYNVQIIDHKSSGHSDAGYDLKSENTRLVRCISSDNKRNYRIWGGIGRDPTQLTDCQSLNPRTRGGIGASAHLWLPGADDDIPAASVIFTGGALKDSSPGSTAVYTDGDGVTVHFIDADMLGLGHRESLFEGEGDSGSQMIIVGSASEPGLTGIATKKDITAIEGLSIAVPLVADGPASWRLIDDGPAAGRFQVLGDRLKGAAGMSGTKDTLIVQARGRNGIAITSSLTVSVAQNPIAQGVALAVSFSGPDGTKSAIDRTGLNPVQFAGDASIQDGAVEFSRGDDFITIPDSDNFSFEGPFTLDTEFMLDDPLKEGGQDVLSHWGDASRQRGYMIRAGEDGALAFVWTYDGSDKNMSVINGPILEAKRYYRIRIDRDTAGTVRLYVDGQMVGSMPGSSAPILNSAVALRISGRESGKYGANGRMRSLTITKGYALAGSDAGYQP